MTVLITGVSGRVGATLAQRLLRAGYRVRGMVRPGGQSVDESLIPDVEVVEASLLDAEALARAVSGATHVVHLAAQLVRGDTPVDRFYDVNALGTLRLLEGVVGSSTVERFVLASSDGTYRPGDPPAVPLIEDVTQEPADYYGTSKLLGEIILRNHAAQFDIPYSIVRFGTVVSPDEASEMFRLRFWRGVLGWQALGKDCHLWQLFRGKPNLLETLERAVGDADELCAVGLVGPDRQPWTLSMVDVRDAADGVQRALTEPQALGAAFNIAAERPTSHAEAATAISQIYGVPKMMVEMPMDYRLEIDIDAARTLLGFRPKHDFRSMVESVASSGTHPDDAFVPTRSTSGVASLSER